eukprot:CAMPEP_0197186062 /NCGR_PEP_ID=MMETSP1423-20130617/13130_1 /TAXON_ID=476441 /ORGANISM="Pseudo-nitzschia heimii, Strain UNC1101" /LENGTH=191 /DNA_ID=CAMNT_0042637269 /DNA_START=86 /DNA_END=658 /DNA_ORIENTATION=+
MPSALERNRLLRGSFRWCASSSFVPSSPRYFFRTDDTRSSRSIDVRVQAEPIPTPAPNPAKTLRALEAPPRASTIPAIPPNTKPAAPLKTTFSMPSRMVSGTTRSDDAVAAAADFGSTSMTVQYFFYSFGVFGCLFKKSFSPIDSRKRILISLLRILTDVWVLFDANLGVSRDYAEILRGTKLNGVDIDTV